MPATALTVDTALRSGVAPTSQTSDETNGNKVAITGYELIRFNNTGGSTYTATFVNEKLSDYGYDNNETCAVPAGAIRYAGPFKYDRWADSSGFLNITWSAGTSTNVTVEVIKLGVQLREVDTK